MFSGLWSNLTTGDSIMNSQPGQILERNDSPSAEPSPSSPSSRLVIPEWNTPPNNHSPALSVARSSAGSPAQHSADRQLSSSHCENAKCHKELTGQKSTKIIVGKRHCHACADYRKPSRHLGVDRPRYLCVQDTASASCENLDCQKELTLRGRPAWFGFKRYCSICADRLKSQLKQGILAEHLRQEYLRATQERKEHSERSGCNNHNRITGKEIPEPTESAASETVDTAFMSQATTSPNETSAAQDVSHVDTLDTEHRVAAELTRSTAPEMTTSSNGKRCRSVRQDVLDYEGGDDDELPPPTKRQRLESPATPNTSRSSSVTVEGDTVSEPVNAGGKCAQNSPTRSSIAKLDAVALPYSHAEEVIYVTGPSAGPSQTSNDTVVAQSLPSEQDTESADNDNTDLKVLSLLNLEAEQQLFQTVVDQVRAKVTAAQSYWVKEKSRILTANEVLRRELVDAQTDLKAMNEEMNQAIRDREQLRLERDVFERELNELKEKVESVSRVLGHTYDQ